MLEVVGGDDVAWARQRFSNSSAGHWPARPVFRLSLPSRAIPPRWRDQGAHRLGYRSTGAVRAALELRVRRRVALARRRVAHAARTSRLRADEEGYWRAHAADRSAVDPRYVPIPRGALPILSVHSRRDEELRHVRLVDLNVRRIHSGDRRYLNGLYARRRRSQVTPYRALSCAHQPLLRLLPAPLLPLHLEERRGQYVVAEHLDAIRHLCGRLRSSADLRPATILLFLGPLQLRRSAAAGAARPGRDCYPEGRGPCSDNSARLA
uniref:Uncharacterized protein n=1 Tax=Eucampia antarctica TaxID=49252 RepID=A0A7S2SL93_9STRA|mmetsp:Transcript_9852/g.9526  ORF Transcript_9852/g.9526 Transcript_9852/m.9526 type:complete len:265 (+) Transcript_9852:409-1203(+)